jgi:parallel beta-helix repeat protein
VLVIFCLFALLNVGILLTVDECKAASTEIWVDNDQKVPDLADGTLGNPYRYIQDAIDAAEDGDIIKVLPGGYPEDLIIDKSVTITNDDKPNTIIQSDSTNSYMIDITADSVSLEGFTIIDLITTSHRKAVIHISPETKNVRLIDNYINRSVAGYGIWIEGTGGDQNAVIKNNTLNSTRGINIVDSNANTIFGNTVANKTGFQALRLFSSHLNRVEKNNFHSYTHGIYSHNSSDTVILSNEIHNNSNRGISLSTTCKRVTIENNNVTNNTNYGIELRAHDSTVDNNWVYGNSIGILLAANSCTITGCTISSSSVYGIYAQGSNSLIYNNTFVNNIGKYLAYEEGNNQWDTGTMGNYWDDFYGADPNDLNNTIPYDSTNVPECYKYKKGGLVDNYPLGIYNSPPWIYDPSPCTLAEGVSKTPSLSVHVLDPDPIPYKDRLDVEFYYVLNDEGFLIDVDSDVPSDSNASVKFSSTVKGKNAVYSYAGLGYDYIGIWYVVVKDDYTTNKSKDWYFSTLKTPIDNKKPEINITYPKTAEMSELVMFDGSNSYDPDGNITFYRWSFGDGTSVTNEISPTHRYLTTGPHNVLMVAIDDQGASNIHNVTVQVEPSKNDPPNALASVPTTGKINQLLTLDASSSYDPDEEDSGMLNYTWDFGDGTNSSGVKVTHKYLSTGSYTVTLTVRDTRQNEDVNYFVITISKSDDDGTPGFELVIALLAILIVLTITRKRRK